ncbi:hypothetical protein AA0114_g11985 [Alternaria tenuissima]|uniref:Ubiquitin-like domain-containing protein n=1 Tax=Alternaria tenuissima TaxID=119927 RepID=A0A4Q4M112_9PLEO|nr:hypothetical protein AA0114_g11985 [Alternaria tenuissima]
MATITSREGTAPPFINNANSYGHSTQTIIGSINHYTRIPDDLPLPAHDVSAGKYFILASTANSCYNSELLQNCRRLNFLISQASLIYPSSTAVLLVCGKAIHDFESKARQGTSFCMMTDLNELRNSLRNCLFYLFTSLLNIHEEDPLSRSSIAGIDEVIGDMLRFHWRCQTIIIKLTGSSFTELEDPIKLYDASRATTFLPIPMILCGSPHQMHLFLLTVYGNRPWHKKIEHNEYILESSDLTKEVQLQNWGEVIRPGEIVYMTMLVKRKGGMSDTSCRECRAMNVEKICANKKMRCLSCGLVLQGNKELLLL